MSSLSVKLSLPTRVQPEVMPQPGMAGVYTNQMHYFKKHLLDELGKKKFASDFMNPVDTEELQIPHYYNVIHRPMDVGTITKRVENNYYRDVEEAIADFKLLIRNCYMFNGVETLVYRKGVQLEKFFLRTIKNIPKGPPVPCNKDPMATCKLKANPMAEAVEQECRNQLRKLQTITNQADATARNFFGPKWNSFSAKLDKQFFKSLEEFRSHVDAMFKKYYDQAKVIYEKVYEQIGCFEGFDSPSASATSSGRGNSSTSPVWLSPAEISDLLLAVQLTMSSFNQCLKQPQKLKSLADTFCATMTQLEMKLEAIRSAIIAQDSSNNGESPINFEEKQVPAGLYLPTENLDFLVDTPDAGLSDDDLKLDPIDQEERRSIQTQFCTLPARAMREICGIVHSNETLLRDSTGGFTFDLNTFDLVNVQIMKAAVARAVKLNSKVNLRDMQPEEKEGLRCSLQSQLSNITERLSQSRRKNAAPPTSERNNHNAKNNRNQKRGKKRAKSPEPQPAEAEPASVVEPKKKAFSLPKPDIPETPVKADIQAGHKASSKAANKSDKSKKGGQKIPCTPIRKFPINPGCRITRKTPGFPVNGTPLNPNMKAPKTPGGWLTGGRIPIVQWTPQGAKVSRGPYRARGRGHVEVRPVQSEPDEDPFEKPAGNLAGNLAGTPERVKIKTLADSSTEEEEDDDIDDEVPSSSHKPPIKKSMKTSNQKTQLFLTPGNVLNHDLNISSSSSEENNSSDED